MRVALFDRARRPSARSGRNSGSRPVPGRAPPNPADPPGQTNRRNQLHHNDHFAPAPGAGPGANRIAGDPGPAGRCSGLEIEKE